MVRRCGVRPGLGRPVICDLCDAGRHRRCGGSCDCAICPVLYKPTGPGPALPKPLPEKPPPPKRTYYVPTGGARGKPKGYSSLSGENQERVAAGLNRGESLSSIARRLGISRDQVRTIRQRRESACAS